MTIQEQLVLSGFDATKTLAPHHSCFHEFRDECPGQEDKAHNSGFQASSPIFHGLCWSWTQPSGWTQQIQDENRPLAERAGFPQSDLSPNGQSKRCWLGLKASQPLPTSAGQHQGGPVSTVHGQFCYCIPSHSANIRFPFMNLNNQTELKSAIASRKNVKDPPWASSGESERDSAKSSPLLSWASQACPIPQATFWSLSV